MFKELYRRLMYYVTVPKCVSCGEKLDYKDRCFCPKCLKAYEEWKTRECSRCAAVLSKCACSNKYLIAHRIRKVVKVYRYRSIDKQTPSNRIIYALKEANRADVFDFLADELAQAISHSIKTDEESITVTNVPRRPVSIRKFGYDHSAELAKRVAKRLGVEYASLLRSRAKKAQKDTVGDERFHNVSLSPKRRKHIDLAGKTVIIVDDIITTGSSMSAAAEKLRELGAKRTIGAAVAVAYKDMYDKII